MRKVHITFVQNSIVRRNAEDSAAVSLSLSHSVCSCSALLWPLKPSNHPKRKCIADINNRCSSRHGTNSKMSADEQSGKNGKFVFMPIRTAYSKARRTFAGDSEKLHCHWSLFVMRCNLTISFLFFPRFFALRSSSSFECFACASHRLRFARERSFLSPFFLLSSLARSRTRLTRMLSPNANDCLRASNFSSNFN